MNRLAYLVSIFILIGFLAGCGASIKPSSSTETFSAPLVTVIGGATRAPLPTVTLNPSAAPSLTPTINLTSTAIYQNELTAYASANAAYSMPQTLAPRFTHICEDSYSPPELSPNGSWLVELCYSPNDQDLIMTFSKIDTPVLWKMAYQDYIPQMDFEPDGGLSVAHWTKDERYAYVFSSLGGDGVECFYQPMERGAGLFRLDLQSGRITTVLRPNNGFWGYSFSFAPTDRRLVFGELSRDLKILDFTTGKTIEISDEAGKYETGGYLWSPDGLKFVYSHLIRNELREWEGLSLRLVDAQSGDERILFDSRDNCFSATSWGTDNILIIQRDGRGGDTIIEYDLNTNNIVKESTATPRP